eukprot:9004524-Pyramimonas_sp.AAC.1
MFVINSTVDDWAFGLGKHAPLERQDWRRPFRIGPGPEEAARRFDGLSDKTQRRDQEAINGT